MNSFLQKKCLPNRSSCMQKSRIKPASIYSPLGLCMALFFCLFLSGCALTNEPESPAEPNLTGVSGKYNPEAELLFGKAHVLWGDEELCSDPEQAILLLDQAIELQSDYANAYIYRALALNQLGYFDEAFEDATTAIRYDPSAAHYAFRGYMLIVQGQYPGARSDLDKAFGIDDSHYRLWKFRGLLNLLEENFTAACSDLQVACDKGDCLGLEVAKKDGACTQTTP